MGMFNCKFSLAIFFLIFGVSQAFFLGNWQEIYLRKHGVSQETINAVNREICAQKCGNRFGLFSLKTQFYCATVCRDVLNESSTIQTSTSSSIPSSTSSSTPSSTSTTSSSTSSSTPSSTSDSTPITTESVGK